ncbi:MULTISPECIES: sensor histidine kinase [unclassified Pantoea]|uniref:Sensor histidine kinase DcuS n=1 Tax=Pantoea sp. BJ2 TaxID=3141322 RepID=A0AAU7U0W2_9GAMM|nr:MULTISPECIES: sensor histidine kinase [unclassified Pantoea]MBY4950785.1 sensor histidine kinase [Pantoea sp. DY-17]MDR6350776.1 two-component system sensor histidine kinase DcuS [Pantoea sp. SORGH_AS_0659]WGK58739.1 sensor histidine kinase [Pantoea sp. SS70]
MSSSQQGTAARKQPMKLNTLVTLMLSAVIVLVLLSVHMFYFFQIGAATRAQLEDKAMAVARTLADSPEIQRALAFPPDGTRIQPIAKAVEETNNLLFITVTNMDGIRYSHRNPELIGKHFIGDDLEPALRGHENVSVNKGSLAKALRVFTPVYNNQHQQIGVVAIGISLDAVSVQINESRWSILWTIFIGTLAGAIGTFVLVRVLKRILFGLEPYEISTLFEQRQAILNSLKEGVVAMDDQAQVTLVNQAARSLLNDSMGTISGDRIYDASVIDDHLRDVLHSGRARRDEELNVNGRVLLSNTVPVRTQGRIIGAVCTFRDKTEISQLMQRLTGMVNYVDALRERSHEFMNKLHVILGLLHMKNYTQVESYILKTANNYQTEIGFLLDKIKSPVIAGFLLSKINRASDCGHRLTISDASFLPDSGNEQQMAALITVIGNLIENALDAMSEQVEGEIHVMLHYQNGWLTCEVSDDGPGIEADHLSTIFEKGFSTKGENRGVGLFLLQQQTENIGGSVSVESEPGVFTQFLVQLPWDGGNQSA